MISAPGKTASATVNNFLLTIVSTLSGPRNLYGRCVYDSFWYQSTANAAQGTPNGNVFSL